MIITIYSIANDYIHNMHAYFIVDELDAETVSHGPHVPVEQLQGCLDELKQKLKAVNVTSRPTKAVDTASEQQKKAHHDALTKEKVFNSDADGASDKSDASNETKALSQNPCSLPLIYRVMSNPSVDDQDGEIWRYVRSYNTYVANDYVHMYVSEINNIKIA